MTLSARIAALEGPDRAVDAKVWAALYGPPDAYVKESPFNGELCAYYKDGKGEERLCERKQGQPPMFTPFTASLDAAMSVFLEKPDMVPSCPIRCLSAALMERGL